MIQVTFSSKEDIICSIQSLPLSEEMAEIDNKTFPHGIEKVATYFANQTVYIDAIPRLLETLMKEDCYWEYAFQWVRCVGDGEIDVSSNQQESLNRQREKINTIIRHFKNALEDVAGAPNNNRNYIHITH